MIIKKAKEITKREAMFKAAQDYCRMPKLDNCKNGELANGRP